MLTKNLEELEECGFIRSWRDYAKDARMVYYQLVDPFALFSICFLNQKEHTSKHTSWMNYMNTPGYYAWRGNTFEMLCKTMCRR